MSVTLYLIQAQMGAKNYGAAASLAAVLGLSPERQQSLAEKFAAKDKAFVYVARQIDDDLASVVMSLDLDGIDVMTEEKRIMPTGEEIGRAHV